MVGHEELGVLIREARLKKGMSLGQLASAVGRSSSSVRRWERGEVAPAATVLPKLVAILEIDRSAIEAAKPSVDISQHGNSSDASGERVSTVEQPVVAPVEFPTSQHGQAEEEPVASSGGLFRDVRAALTKGHRSWIGWIRGLLTAGALILMLFVLLWAISELFDAFGAVLDSFTVGSSGNQ